MMSCCTAFPNSNMDRFAWAKGRHGEPPPSLIPCPRSTRLAAPLPSQVPWKSLPWDWRYPEFKNPTILPRTVSTFARHVYHARPLPPHFVPIPWPLLGLRTHPCTHHLWSNAVVRKIWEFRGIIGPCDGPIFVGRLVWSRWYAWPPLGPN